jgi:hypothetical protein
VPENFDTDKFGTFTRDIKRKGTQKEVAIKKAKEALRTTGLDLAVASEGSFGPSRQAIFLQSNLEIVVLIDTLNKFEIIGYAESLETNIEGRYVNSIDEAIEFADALNFPKFGIILRLDEACNTKDIYKECVCFDDLKQVVKTLFKKSKDGRIYLETDMRAHRNPLRMKVIKKATMDLIKKIKSKCPNCFVLGYEVVDTELGLECEFCGSKTRIPKYLIYKCRNCKFVSKSRVQENQEFASPQNCSICNP